MDWFLYENSLRHERVKGTGATSVKIAAEMKKCSRLKEISIFNVLWNFQPI